MFGDCPFVSKVALAVAEGMRKDGVHSIGWGDDCIVNYAGHLVKVKRPHPLNVMKAVMAHLDRTPSIFEKRKRRSANSRGAEVLVRSYRLRS